MEMRFEEGKVYDFNYKGVKFFGGKSYLLLTYGETKAETLPGFEADGLVFRAEAYDYQLKDENTITDVIPCYVAGFVKDIDGQNTSFPILKQDIRSILQKNYDIGKSYPFTIAASPGELNEKQEKLECYLVHDPLDFEHYLYTTAEYKKGDTVELTVDKFGSKWLEFADPVRQRIKELFEIGKEYDFHIESEEIDEKSGKNFFALRDKIEGFLHRFYFTDEHSASPGEDIRLTVKAITPKGWLLLAEPGKSISAKELLTLEQIEDNTLGRETDQLEYKSSFVYTATSDRNIDAQLGHEIMQQLAAFMNAKGGTVCLGYQNDGSICGINRDIQFLNSSTEDEYTYEPTLDGIELKIRNTIARKLGGFANSLVDIGFRKNKSGLLVCHLTANPSAKPVFLNSTVLYKRSGNMCQRLKGDEITFFVLDHLTQIMQNAKLAFIAPSAAPASDKTEETVAVAPGEMKTPVAFALPEQAKAEKVLQYISLYKDGTVSRQKQESAEPDVLFNIPFTASCRNKSSRLLLCYDNGCVNVLNPGEVAKEKLKDDGKRYKNGLNQNAGLLSVFTCGKEDYLVIRSRRNDGTDMIKALPLEEYSVHNPQSMQTQGNKVLDVKNAAVVRFDIVPGEQSSFIYPVIVRSKNGVAGFPAHSAKIQGVLAFLKKNSQDTESADARS